MPGRGASLNIVRLVGSILLCQAAGAFGAVFTAKAIPTWYAKLKRPSFNPPNWVFAPVWTLLYTLMGVALYRLWCLAPDSPERSLALGLFFLQLVLNALWTPLFFGRHALWASFIEILFMLAAIVAMTLELTKIEMVSAWLMVPYTAWVSFATLLNYSYAKINP
jgi:translocator protein